MSNSNPVSHTDAEAELAEYAREIRAFGKQAVIEIGKRLIKAKAIAGHGNWLPWLDREFGWTDDTALNFMRVATLAESRNFRDLNVPVSGLYLLAAPSTPTEVVEAIAERGEQGERLSLAEVKTIIAEVKARAARTIEYEVDDEEPPQEREISYARVGFEKGDAEQAYRSRYGDVRQVRHQVTYERETVVVPYYVPHEQPAPRTIEDFQRDRIRGRAEALARHLEGVEHNLDEHDTGAIIEALSDEERDQARRVVDKLKAALDEDEMSEAPDQLN
jgi:hypothetical protein